MKHFFILFILLTLIGPFIILMSGGIDFKADYRSANRKSAGIAPDPSKTSDAIIQVYSARTFNWRGIFAVHTWIAVKTKNASFYTVYHLIGWRSFWNLPIVAIEKDLPDRYWFNQKPNMLLDIRGEKAEKIIPKIEQAAQSYPYPNTYNTWPGPNSNTFIAWIARAVPEMQLALPSNAIGKDYLPIKNFLSPAPSGTGYQLSIDGVMGIMLAKKEGLEINILGLVYGFNPFTLTLKLPGFGDLNFGRINQ